MPIAIAMGIPLFTVALAFSSGQGYGTITPSESFADRPEMSACTTSTPET